MRVSKVISYMDSGTFSAPTGFMVLVQHQQLPKTQGLHGWERGYMDAGTFSAPAMFMVLVSTNKHNVHMFSNVFCGCWTYIDRTIPIHIHVQQQQCSTSGLPGWWYMFTALLKILNRENWFRIYFFFAFFKMKINTNAFWQFRWR